MRTGHKENVVMGDRTKAWQLSKFGASNLEIASRHLRILAAVRSERSSLGYSLDRADRTGGADGLFQTSHSGKCVGER